MVGIIGTKIGMARIIQEDGRAIPVTVVECPPNTVTQIKDGEKDGYTSLVLGYGELKKPTKTKKFRFIREVPLENDAEYKKGDIIDTKVLEGIESISVTGISKGKGFQGVIKRHNFSRGPETHGSHHHREPGSIGACAKPGRVHKGKKLPGQMGNAKITRHNIPIVHIDHSNNLVCLKGAIPGFKGCYILMKKPNNL
ncbi:50S ribosomal protein L3 [Patescibacteria group bacterium]|nr:50S ribosomal protein L3 [Patescibacteria group bacterium]